MHEITVDYWNKLTPLEQLGNIGSEVGRSIKAYEKKDKSFDSALYRALDLFEITAKCWISSHPNRVKELLRAKEEYLRLFFDDNFNDAEKIEKYFMYFAYAARYLEFGGIDKGSIS